MIFRRPGQHPKDNRSEQICFREAFCELSSWNAILAKISGDHLGSRYAENTGKCSTPRRKLK